MANVLAISSSQTEGSLKESWTSRRAGIIVSLGSCKKVCSVHSRKNTYVGREFRELEVASQNVGAVKPLAVGFYCVPHGQQWLHYRCFYCRRREVTMSTTTSSSPFSGRVFERPFYVRDVARSHVYLNIPLSGSRSPAFSCYWGRKE